MSTILKIAGLSAVLAAGLVAASLPTGASVPTAKAFTERLPEMVPAPAPQAKPAGDALPATPCAKTAWPYLPHDCVAEGRQPVRTIAIGPRDAASTATPVRTPVRHIAAR